MNKKLRAVIGQCLAVSLLLTTVFSAPLLEQGQNTYAETEAGAVATHQIASSEDWPTDIPAGETYVLTNSITLEAGQQIENLEGTLDGQGYTVTLADQALAKNVSGTIENLGVAGSQTLNFAGVSGSMAETLSGTIQNAYSTVDINTSGWSDIGGLVGKLQGGTIRNCYYGGTSSAMFANGLVAEGYGGSIANCLATIGFGAVGVNNPKPETVNYEKVTAAALQTEETVTKLNQDLADTGFQFALPGGGGLPVLVPASGGGSTPAVTTAVVDFTAQAENGFLCAPQKGVEVRSDLAEQYGLVDNVEGQVSALDVLVKAHEEIFGDVDGMLELYPSGWIKTVFAVPDAAFGFALNGSTTTTMIGDTPVESGAALEFWLYQDTASWGDGYVHFSQDGTDATELSALALTAGEPKFLYVRGYSIAWGKDASPMTAKKGLQVAVVSEDGGLTDLPGAVTGDDGKVSLTFPEAGTYNITLYAPSGTGPVVMHLFPVTVQAAAPGPITEPVAKPADESQITHIKSQSDLDRINFTQEGAFYVLDNDITVDSSYWVFDNLAGVFDGQGHTVTFANPYAGLFAGVSETGVVQNTYFTGSLGGSNQRGPVGYTLKGTIVNCYSDVTGDAASGFAKTLDGGQLLNAYSISTAKNGVLFAKGTAGRIENTYWLQGSKNPVAGTVTVVGSGEKTEAEMKTKDFAALLNLHKGTHGTAWGQSSTGYPYFGADQGYVPETPGLEENRYPVELTLQGSTEKIELTGQELAVGKEEANAFGFYGTFALKDVPADSQIAWSLEAVTPEKSMMVGADSGQLFVYQDGEGVLTATEIKADGSQERAASIRIKASTKKITDIKLFIDGTEVSGDYTVQGSEWKEIQVKALYQGATEYVSAPENLFQYLPGDESYIKNMGFNSFYFKKPGTAAITVSVKSNPTVSKTLSVTSEYVPVESVKPAISGTKVLHGRNANSENSIKFIPEIATVIVTPENASCRNDFTITSSNPEVAEYVGSMVLGYVPLKAGTTTFTATIHDNGKDVPGTSQVTYVYQNPLQSIGVGTPEVTVKNNTDTTLDLTFVGEKSGLGYSVTEPGIVWTYDKPDIVKIEQTGSGWKRDESAPDNNCWIPGTTYRVSAINEGVVVATGTPLDLTGGASPIVVKITVKAGDAQAADVDAIVNKVTAGVTERVLQKEYAYGDEWTIYELARSGTGLTDTQKQSYLRSVTAEIKTWKSDEQATDIERTAMALLALGQDITNVDGSNVAAMIYNHPELGRQGSNGFAWGLLALDMKQTPIPSGATWTRETMVQELLKYQKADGGFGLDVTGPSGVDITAMALQALAPYKEGRPEVQKAVEDGFAYLKKQQKADCGFGDNLESAAQVLLAMVANDMDPVSTVDGFGTPYKNIITFMDQYYLPDAGEFRHVISGKGNGMATIQGLQSMTAYKLWRAGGTYWDLTEPLVDGGGKDPVKPKPQDPVPTTATTRPEAAVSGSQSEGGTHIDASASAGTGAEPQEKDVAIGWTFSGETYEAEAANLGGDASPADEAAQSGRAMNLWLMAGILAAVAVAAGIWLVAKRKKETE